MILKKFADNIKNYPTCKSSKFLGLYIAQFWSTLIHADVCFLSSVDIEVKILVAIFFHVIIG